MARHTDNTQHNMYQVYINCFIEQTIYKACPKCNDKHVGNCEHCAWSGCFGPCNIEPRVYHDGSFTKIAQAIPKVVNEFTFVHINKRWNIAYFETKEACEQAIREYQQIL